MEWQVAPGLGSADGLALHWVAVGAACSGSAAGGYYLVAADGTVHAFGDATVHR
jgi:hypothetical protein